MVCRPGVPPLFPHSSSLAMHGLLLKSFQGLDLGRPRVSGSELGLDDLADLMSPVCGCAGASTMPTISYVPRAGDTLRLLLSVNPPKPWQTGRVGSDVLTGRPLG